MSRLIAHVLHNTEAVPHPQPNHWERLVTLANIDLKLSRTEIPNEAVKGGVSRIIHRLETDRWAMELNRDAAGNPDEQRHLWHWVITGDASRWQRDMTLLKLFTS